MAFTWFKKNRSKTHESENEPAVQPEPDPPENGGDDAVLAMDDTPGNASPPPAAPPEAAPSGQSPAPIAASPEKGGFFKRLKQGLSKTRAILNTDIEELFAGGRKVDEELLEELEELLITSDIGVQTAMDLMAHISKKASRIRDALQLKAELKSEILRMIQDSTPPEPTLAAPPHVVMVVGVNGVGKTTTIGKLAAQYSQAGKKVLIAAADTFRAAAMEQLTVWAERAGAMIVKHKDGSDPAAVAFDGLEAALARKMDIVLVDTAGRLHTKVNLMEELKKIKRAVAKKLPDAPHDILLVLDATTGQNALAQAKMFDEALEITGLALTKLDGTAKGGIVVSILNSLNVPLRYIGVGEQLEDLQPFDPERFVDALF